jgi:hypothetical protein
MIIPPTSAHQPIVNPSSRTENKDQEIIIPKLNKTSSLSEIKKKQKACRAAAVIRLAKSIPKIGLNIDLINEVKKSANLSIPCTNGL